MSEHIEQSPQTTQSPENAAKARALENQRLLSIIDNGVDRVAVKSAYDAFRAQKPKGALVGEGQFDNILVYQDFASPEATLAHDELVANSVGLAYAAVNGVSHRYNRLDSDDLDQEAWSALSLAAWQYNSNIKMAFPSYVTRIVLNRLDRLRSQSDFALRLQPQHVHMANVSRARGMNLMKTSSEDVESVTEMFGPQDAKFVMRIEASFQHVRSLDETHGRKTDYFNHDGQPTTGTWNDISDKLLTNVHQEMEDEVEWSVTAEPAVRNLLNQLPDRERKIIEMRFGIFDGEPYTLEQVASVFGVTRERIRQLEHKSFAMIRRLAIGAEGTNTYEDLPVKSSNGLTAPGSVENNGLEVQNAQIVARYKDEKEQSFAALRSRQGAIHAWGAFETEHEGTDRLVRRAALVLLVDGVMKKEFWKKADWSYLTEIERSGLPDVRHESVKEYLGDCIVRLNATFTEFPSADKDRWGYIPREVKTQMVKSFIEQEIAEQSELRQQALLDNNKPYKISNVVEEQAVSETAIHEDAPETNGLDGSEKPEDYPNFYKYLEAVYGFTSDFYALLQEAGKTVEADFEGQDLRDPELYPVWCEAIEWYIAERV